MYKQIALFVAVLAVAGSTFAATTNRLLWGEDPWNPTTGLTFTSYNLNSSTYRIAWNFQAKSTETITHVVTCSTSVTGTTSRYRVSIQSLDANGLPNGILGGGTPASRDSIVSSTWGADTCVEHSLTNASPALTVGTYYAVVVDAGTGGTNDASNFVSFKAALPFVRGTSGNLYTINDADGSWVVGDKTVNAGVFGAHGSTQWYGRPLTAASVGTYSATAEVGARFEIVSGLSTSMQLSGIRWIGKSPGAGNSIYITVYAGGDGASPSVLRQETLDGDFASTASANRTTYEHYFASPVTLTPGTTYHVGLSASGGTPDLNFLSYFSNAAMGERFGGAAITYVSRTIGAAPPSGEAAAFTEVDTDRPGMSLIITDITGGGGGGGGSYVIGG